MAQLPPGDPTAARERAYAEWYAWALANLGSAPAGAHAAAQAALDAAALGRSSEEAARQAAARPIGGWWSPPPALRAYAEWYEWARLNLGGPPEALHRAAAAARAARDAGAGEEAAVGAAQAAAAAAAVAPAAPAAPAVSVGPAAQPWAGAAAWEPGAPAPGVAEARPAGSGADFYRSPGRAAALIVVANVPYLFWWLYGIFVLARREGLPRARSFWWILVPLYNLVVVYRVLDDLRQAEAPATGRASRLSPGLFLTLLVLASALARVPVPGGWPTVALFLLSQALVAGGALMVQQSANGFLAAVHPTAGPRGMTAGEIAATVGGVFLLSLVVIAAFLPPA
jgi:hypothetical protein